MFMLFFDIVIFLLFLFVTFLIYKTLKLKNYRSALKYIFLIFNFSNLITIALPKDPVPPSIKNVLLLSLFTLLFIDYIIKIS
jgi:hypothetical protein